MVSLPLYLRGAVPPRADSTDPNSAIAGVVKRAARKTPTPDPNFLKRFNTFVKRYLNEQVEPLQTDCDFSFSTWLNNVSYPLWRKQELHDLWERNSRMTPLELMNLPKACDIKAFVKQEFYDEFKYQRGIYSRTDIFKIAIGPLMRCIEKQVFRDEWFIKKIPVSDRPRYIMDKLSKFPGVSMATDYTSFEACFTREVMEACEFELYRHMVKNLPTEATQAMEKFCSVVSGTNLIKFKHFNAKWEATRMSGEMNTSLGNGFTNMMIMKFLCHENGTKVAGVVEGDDGLFTFEDPSKAPTEKQFSDLGFIVKMQIFERFNEASFCGLIFDENDLCNITDPYYVLSTFGWTESRYGDANWKTHMMLLRAKGYSLGYQYPSCPVISVLAEKILELTRSFNIKQSYIDNLDVYSREKLLDSLTFDRKDFGEPGIRTRLLMSDLYGLSVEAQIYIENQIRNVNSLGSLNLDWLLQFFPQPYLDNWDKFVCNDPYFPKVTSNQKIEEIFDQMILPSGGLPTWLRV